ncbi:LysM domain-containing protein [Leifsonia sp. C5G2]|uniref:LysM peptidoglycan-binding domain-containing protein n=1 Tax=Leifsonia sp. C5G2 TaxID=2735269 RepID=UPI0015848C55|nr:LysM domain-containing protein [Leifsonia sp. C5G2]NUU08309.1 LysM peptidoglycan-binding domain-containing protein [Leifsonia sp. C5G2]
MALADTGRIRAALGTVPIAVASSLAMTLNLVTPAQAAPPEDTRADHPGDTGRIAPLEGATVTSTIGRPASASPARTAVAAVPATYRVQSGDTVSGIAGRFGLSTAAVLAMNGLSWKSLIFPGQVLALAGPAAAPAPAAPAAPAPAPSAPATTTYTVVRGDTVSGIAGRFGVSTKAVLAANGLTASALIFPGQHLRIPGMTTASLDRPAAVPAPAAPVVASPAPLPAVAAGQVVALSDEMRANAQLIVRIGRQQGVPDQGIVIALAAAAQESGLRNVRYGDRDSLGLFQQRPSTGWGTPDQVLDPARATLAFYGGAGNPNPGRTRGLLDVPGWRSMTVTQAAQAVQLSAFPDAYAKWEASARAWLTQLG